jgi:hypothetical protein
MLVVQFFVPKLYILSDQVWQGWQAPGSGDGGAGDGAEGSKRLLMGRTLAALGGRWPQGAISITADDVADLGAATAWFNGVLKVWGEGLHNRLFE